MARRLHPARDRPRRRVHHRSPTTRPRRRADSGRYTALPLNSTAGEEPARGPRSMQLRISTDQPWDIAADVLAIPIIGEPTFVDGLGEIDRRTDGELRALADFGEMSGRQYSTTIGAAGKLPLARILTVNAGEPEQISRETIHRLGAAIERRLGGRAVRRLAIWVADLASHVEGGAATAAELLTRGVVEGSYDPKSIYLATDRIEDALPQLDELIIVAPGSHAATLEKAAMRGQIMGEGANFARTLSNRASNDLSPDALADEASALARRHDLSIDVIEPKRAEKLGMGMFLAVGRGSDNPPRMIVLRSGGGGERDGLDRHLALVGKGVCFDSGGISIKAADRMEEMKMDKTGAATVIAAIATVARLAPGTPLLAVAPAVENMPGPHSTRPGDIVTALNGKKVDITNTDAEGRLILGDALTYAERLGATHLVDVATLTGAVGRALGNQVTGAFGAPQSFYDDVVAAGERAGERYWQLPLIEDY